MNISLFRANFVPVLKVFFICIWLFKAIFWHDCIIDSHDKLIGLIHLIQSFHFKWEHFVTWGLFEHVPRQSWLLFYNLSEVPMEHFSIPVQQVWTRRTHFSSRGRIGRWEVITTSTVRCVVSSCSAHHYNVATLKNITFLFFFWTIWQSVPL